MIVHFRFVAINERKALLLCTEIKKDIQIYTVPLLVQSSGSIMSLVQILT